MSTALSRLKDKYEGILASLNSEMIENEEDYEKMADLLCRAEVVEEFLRDINEIIADKKKYINLMRMRIKGHEVDNVQ